jgi:hypothetical protein
MVKCMKRDAHCHLSRSALAIEKSVETCVEGYVDGKRSERSPRSSSGEREHTRSRRRSADPMPPAEIERRRVSSILQKKAHPWTTSLQKIGPHHCSERPAL